MPSSLLKKWAKKWGKIFWVGNPFQIVNFKNSAKQISFCRMFENFVYCEPLWKPDAFSWGVGAFFPGRKVFLEVPSTIKLSHLIDSQGWYLGALSQTFAQSLPCSISWTFKKCTSIRFYYSEGSCILEIRFWGLLNAI